LPTGTVRGYSLGLAYQIPFRSLSSSEQALVFTVVPQNQSAGFDQMVDGLIRQDK
jgi:hypothetical protein